MMELVVKRSTYIRPDDIDENKSTCDVTKFYEAFLKKKQKFNTKQDLYRCFVNSSWPANHCIFSIDMCRNLIWKHLEI